MATCTKHQPELTLRPLTLADLEIGDTFALSPRPNGVNDHPRYIKAEGGTVICTRGVRPGILAVVLPSSNVYDVFRHGLRVHAPAPVQADPTYTLELNQDEAQALCETLGASTPAIQEVLGVTFPVYRALQWAGLRARSGWLSEPVLCLG